jgi:hypothetical protein
MSPPFKNTEYALAKGSSLFTKQEDKATKVSLCSLER